MLIPLHNKVMISMSKDSIDAHIELHIAIIAYVKGQIVCGLETNKMLLEFDHGIVRNSDYYSSL